jgi:hypothetical protein
LSHALREHLAVVQTSLFSPPLPYLAPLPLGDSAAIAASRPGIELYAADIEPAPDFGGAIDARFITGMAKAASGVKVLVDLDLIAAAETLTFDASPSDKPFASP